jgi:signal transduction histidine kinase
MDDMPNWQAVTALIASIVLISGVFTFAVKAIMRQELQTFDKIYMRRAEADLHFQQIEDHFDALKAERIEDRATVAAWRDHHK